MCTHIYNNSCTCVVTGGEEVERGMTGNDPEAVVLTAEGVKAVPLAHIPHPDNTSTIMVNSELYCGSEHDREIMVIYLDDDK